MAEPTRGTNDVDLWILVAESSRARIFAAESLTGDWRLVHELSHPASRAHVSDLVTGEKGRLSYGKGLTSAREPTGAKDLEAHRFAGQLCELLYLGLTRNAYGRLVVVAPPSFLGLLRENLADNVAKAVVDVVAKDYTRLRESELADRLAEEA